MQRLKMHSAQQLSAQPCMPPKPQPTTASRIKGAGSLAGWRRSHLCMHDRRLRHGRYPHDVPSLPIFAHHRRVCGLVQEVADGVADVVQAGRRPRRPRLLQRRREDSWVGAGLRVQTVDAAV